MDRSVTHKILYGPQLPFGPYSILWVISRIINWHMALSPMNYLLNMSDMTMIKQSIIQTLSYVLFSISLYNDSLILYHILFWLCKSRLTLLAFIFIENKTSYKRNKSFRKTTSRCQDGHGCCLRIVWYFSIVGGFEEITCWYGCITETDDVWQGQCRCKSICFFFFPLKCQYVQGTIKGKKIYCNISF